MSKPKKQKYKLKISSITENLEIIREFINKIARKAGFSDEGADQIELAVDEACTNVIKHAYHFDSKRMLDISVLVDKEKIEIIVTDKGSGFDPDQLMAPDIPKYAHEAKVGGLGIHLMKSLMDEVSYSFNPGKRNSVSLVKYYSRKSA